MNLDTEVGAKQIDKQKQSAHHKSGTDKAANEGDDFFKVHDC